MCMSYFILSKICVFIMLKSFIKIERWKKCIVEKDDFEILRWTFVTFNDLWGHTLFYKKMCPNIDSTHIVFLSKSVYEWMCKKE